MPLTNSVPVAPSRIAAREIVHHNEPVSIECSSLDVNAGCRRQCCHAHPGTGARLAGAQKVRPYRCNCSVPATSQPYYEYRCRPQNPDLVAMPGRLAQERVSADCDGCGGYAAAQQAANCGADSEAEAERQRVLQRQLHPKSPADFEFLHEQVRKWMAKVQSMRALMRMQSASGVIAKEAAIKPELILRVPVPAGNRGRESCRHDR